MSVFPSSKTAPWASSFCHCIDPNQPIYNFSICCAGMRKGLVCMQTRPNFLFEIDDLIGRADRFIRVRRFFVWLG
jgi:hypothetical protein